MIRHDVMLSIATLSLYSYYEVVLQCFQVPMPIDTVFTDSASHQLSSISTPGPVLVHTGFQLLIPYIQPTEILDVYISWESHPILQEIFS